MIAFHVLFFFISFFVGFIFFPFLIKSLLNNGLTGRDMHKPGFVKVPEFGGVGIVFSFVVSILLYIALITFSNRVININLVAATLSIILAGFIGLIDDLLKFRWRTKIAAAFIPAIPLIVLNTGNSMINIPIIGFVDVGILFPLVFIPLMVNFAINSFNMLAGFNGLESGMALISLFTILLASNNSDVVILSACSLGAVSSFFFFNKFPSKIFPGDTGTFVMGAMIISSIIIGNMEKLALGVFLLYFINFILLFSHLKSKCRNKFSRIEVNGILKPDCWHAVYWLFPYFLKNVSEKKNVFSILIVQFLICFISLILFLYVI